MKFSSSLSRSPSRFSHAYHSASRSETKKKSAINHGERRKIVPTPLGPSSGAFFFADHRQLRHRIKSQQVTIFLFLFPSLSHGHARTAELLKHVHQQRAVLFTRALQRTSEQNFSLFLTLGELPLSLGSQFDRSPHCKPVVDRDRRRRRRVFGCFGVLRAPHVLVAAACFEAPMFVCLIYGCIHIMRKLLKKGKWKYVYIRAHTVVYRAVVRSSLSRCCWLVDRFQVLHCWDGGEALRFTRGRVQTSAYMTSPRSRST